MKKKFEIYTIEKVKAIRRNSDKVENAVHIIAGSLIFGADFDSINDDFDVIGICGDREKEEAENYYVDDNGIYHAE